MGDQRGPGLLNATFGNSRSPRVALRRARRLSRCRSSRRFLASCEGSQARRSWSSSPSASRRRRRNAATLSTMRSCFSSRARALTASWSIARAALAGARAVARGGQCSYRQGCSGAWGRPYCDVTMRRATFSGSGSVNPRRI